MDNAQILLELGKLFQNLLDFVQVRYPSESRGHCASIALDIFRDALEDYEKKCTKEDRKAELKKILKESIEHRVGTKTYSEIIDSLPEEFKSLFPKE